MKTLLERGDKCFIPSTLLSKCRKKSFYVENHKKRSFFTKGGLMLGSCDVKEMKGSDDV